MLGYKRRKAEQYLVYFAEPIFIYAEPSILAAKELSDCGFYAIAENVWNSSAQHFDMIYISDKKVFTPANKLFHINTEEDLASEEFQEWLKSHFGSIENNQISEMAKELRELASRNEELDKYDRIIQTWELKIPEKGDIKT